MAGRSAEARGGSGGVDGDRVSESESTLALIKQKLHELSTNGDIHYVGESTSITDGGDTMVPTENVVFSVAPSEDPPAGFGVKDTWLIEKARDLSESLGVKGARSSAWLDSAWQEICFTEPLVTRTVQVGDVLNRGDMSPEMKSAVAKTPAMDTLELVRRIEIRVYLDRETAETARRLDTGQIDRRGLSIEKRRERYPVATRLLDAFSSRKPREPRR